MTTPQFILDLRKKIDHAEPSRVQPCGLYVGEVSSFAAKDRGLERIAS
ncbi:hypothetical protein G1C98_0586 [Bifidobacterium sp. DSM 109960]|uniref:Uncharacterized protein n=1 Tax=Bifidobacterium erythrocebi TaxID=2675325 RepID=A0A7Y0HT55_9BIFI|nr:hypothetical protein [Bifidobacterium sp. DSM 109960]NMM95850.1 hypothetical protein [Bifidobacterium sp. DSM 109960]